VDDADESDDAASAGAAAAAAGAAEAAARAAEAAAGADAAVSAEALGAAPTDSDSCNLYYSYCSYQLVPKGYQKCCVKFRTTPSVRTGFPAVIQHSLSEHLNCCLNQQLETI
jgi:hypothetical protein